MTVVEIMGAVGAAAAAAVAGYRVWSAKLEAIVGKKDGDGSLRDVVLRLEGKVDAHSEATSQRLDNLTDRVGALEARVFTPPRMMAVRPRRDQ